MNTNQLTYPKPSVIADLMVFKPVWQLSPKKSLVSGMWLRNFEGTPVFLNCFCHILNPKEYPGFRHYLGNICLTTPAEREIWERGKVEDQISYAKEVNERSGGRNVVDWTRMSSLVDPLKEEYKKAFPTTFEGIIGYKYSIEFIGKTLSVLNKRFLEQNNFI